MSQDIARGFCSHIASQEKVGRRISENLKQGFRLLRVVGNFGRVLSPCEQRKNAYTG